MKKLELIIAKGFKVKEIALESNVLVREKSEYENYVIEILFGNLLLKANAINTLIEHNNGIGGSMILRSILEGYVYLKYIYEQKSEIGYRAEAYYIYTSILSFNKILNNFSFNSSYSKKEKLIKALNGIVFIEPFFANGHSLEYYIKRYSFLIDSKYDDINQKLPEFYSRKNNNNKKITNFGDLCDHLGEYLNYEIVYRILSLEIHSISDDTHKVLESIDFLRDKCIELINESTDLLIKNYDIKI